MNNIIKGRRRRSGNKLCSDQGKLGNTRHMRRIINVLFTDTNLNYCGLKKETGINVQLTDCLNFLLNIGIIKRLTPPECRLAGYSETGKVYTLTSQALTLYLKKELKGGTK